MTFDKDTSRWTISRGVPSQEQDECAYSRADARAAPTVSANPSESRLPRETLAFQERLGRLTRNVVHHEVQAAVFVTPDVEHRSDVLVM
jgi:hypothetical protein